MNDTNKAPSGGQQELRAFLERYPATQVLELLQPDMVGILRGKRVMRGEFSDQYFADYNVAFDLFVFVRREGTWLLKDVV